MKKSRRKRFVRCVRKISARQHSETKPYNAYTVCRASTGYKGTSYNIGIKHKPFSERKARKGAAIEHKEHPEFTYRQAYQIAKDHLKENPNYYNKKFQDMLYNENFEYSEDVFYKK